MINKNVCLTITSSLLIIPNIGLSIWALIVAYNTGLKTNPCDNFIVPLPLWLIVNSAINLLYLLIGTLFLVCFYFKERLSYFIIFITVSLCETVFLIFWNIIGTTALFQDSDCKEKETYLWNLILLNLVCQWISILFSACIFCTKLNSNICERDRNYENYKTHITFNKNKEERLGLLDNEDSSTSTLLMEETKEKEVIV